MNKKKTNVIFVKADNDLRRRLKKASQAADVPMSQIVRDAIKQRLDEMATVYPELKAA